jgi:chromate transporter
VLVLIACGLVELGRRRGASLAAIVPVPLLATVATGGVLALAWTAFKVGALSYGGGFVVIPLMQADAVDHHHWMTSAEFLNAVALGQATPGAVVQTVSAVGYAAHGVGGALLAALVAFAPSFWFIGLGAARFDRLRTDPTPQAFLAGAGPAAIGAILGSAVPLTLALDTAWQLAVLAVCGLLLIVRRNVVWTLALGALCGAAAAVAGIALPD